MRLMALVSALAITLGATPALAHPLAPPAAMSTVAPQDAGAGGGNQGGEEAKQAYREGSKAYAMGNYEEAVERFERSYALSQRPELLYNLGQAYARWYELSQDVAHLRKSARLYKNYLQYLDQTDGDAAAREDVQTRLAEVETQIQAAETAAPEDPAPGDGPKDADAQRKRRNAIIWGTVAGVLVVAGGVTAAVLLTRDDGTSDPELGTIGMTRGLGFRF